MCHVMCFGETGEVSPTCKDGRTIEHFQQCGHASVGDGAVLVL
jgi:hypothetical protein